jgi:hypothetical protein
METVECINESKGSGIFPSQSVPGNFHQGNHTQATVFQKDSGILFAHSHTTLTGATKTQLSRPACCSNQGTNKYPGDYIVPLQ